MGSARSGAEDPAATEDPDAHRIAPRTSLSWRRVIGDVVEPVTMKGRHARWPLPDGARGAGPLPTDGHAP